MLLFSDVAEVFSEIEKRSGRLEMTDVLAALFARTGKDEIDKLVYIVQGIIAPPYEGLDLGVGEKFAIEAIASRCGIFEKPGGSALQEERRLGRHGCRNLSGRRGRPRFSPANALPPYYQPCGRSGNHQAQEARSRR